MTAADLNSSSVSLCIDCARNPSLKRCIEADATAGICGLCARSGVIVRNPANIEPLAMLLRSLIRFYWDEVDYNSHFGGNSPLALFQDPENPVLTPPASDEYTDDFDELLQSLPFPEYDEGISIYAGHSDDGMHLANRAISRTEPRVIPQLQKRLLKENFFAVEPALEVLIDPFIVDISSGLPAKSLWFRGRIGFAAAYIHMDLESGYPTRYQPYLAADIGAPPPPKATAGRLNRSGVSFLYLASDVHTAMAEVRPHPGHLVSIGGFTHEAPLKVADFNPDIALFATSDKRLDQYELIQAFDRMMSMPVTPEERSRYLLTQLLAEVLMKKGFDGVTFRSSISSGINLCVFQPQMFSYVEEHATVRRVDGVRYSDSAAACVVRPTSDDHVIE